MVDTAGVLGMAGSIRSGGRRAAIATTALGSGDIGGCGGELWPLRPPRCWRLPPRPECHGVAATIVGTAGDDKIIGTNKADVIVAGAGDDLVKGRGGDDVICDRDGDDVVRGGKGDDVLRGAAGADLVVGGAGTDLLRGGRGKDDLRGGTGDDRLNGGLAVDDCDGGPGVNTLVNCENIPNAAPVAADDAAGTTEDAQKLLDVLANDTDPDGDSLLVTSVDATGLKGTVTITGGGSGVSYDPHGQFEALGAGVPGADSFSYTISPTGKGGTDTASVASDHQWHRTTRLTRWPIPRPWQRTRARPDHRRTRQRHRYRRWLHRPITQVTQPAKRHGGHHQRRRQPDLRAGCAFSIEQTSLENWKLPLACASRGINDAAVWYAGGEKVLFDETVVH